MQRVLVVCGTRPEAIKLAPVIEALRRRPSQFDVSLCVTGQHRELLDPVLQFFSLVPRFDLALMAPGQSLNELLGRALIALQKVLLEARPDVVVVQGDTTTALAGAMAAFHCGVRVAHVEAGLRTHDRTSPFPEEMNRVLVTRLAERHFVPTQTARRHLEAEGVTAHVHVTGNTVVDALLSAHALVQRDHRTAFASQFAFLDPQRRCVLVTGHRRESFGEPFEHICRAIKTLAERFDDVDFVYPVHLNPNVRKPVDDLLRGTPRVHLIEPVDYPRLVYLLSRCTFVLTDSGGIQEEAPSLGKPVLVMRETTERPEGLEAGCARLVGTDSARIVAAATQLLTDPSALEQMSRVQNPYGDGRASERIAELLSGSS